MRFLCATFSVLSLLAVSVQSIELESNSTLLVASVGPITENPIPPWADKMDFCERVGSCDDCSEERGAALYCKYSELGEATCCTAAKHPKYKNGKLTMTASVGPIIENPIPSWASSSDVCSIIGSCDSCPAQANKYCFYKDNGDATCCNGQEEEPKDSDISIATSPSGSDIPADGDSDSNDIIPVAVAPIATISIDEEIVGVKFVASVVPIEQDPIPSWASSSDICSKRRSCDVCGEKSYCKYTESGIPQCCLSSTSTSSSNSISTPNNDDDANNNNNNDNNDNVDGTVSLVASVGPITENPIPDWASDIDLCQPASCDACQDKSIQYCKWTEQGNQLCCNKQQ